MREWWDRRWGMLGWGGSFRNHLLSAKRQQHRCEGAQLLSSLPILGVDPISEEASHGSSCQTGHTARLSLSPVSPPRPR